ncbi:biotin/lipoyl-containing protein [Nocardia miyunensis]|uniref:biotin/lipoyl-containing protein n=1 Tax=Nocardia miyunensis TaxID=282684 RepID=UPI00082EFC4E|nr:biotin/lipoyl-containing protein [Nocardia miyunensis]
MSVQVQMPALGESVTEGTILQWLKNEGESVTEGESLLEVATDKVDTEIPSPATGVLRKIIARTDDVVAVGGDLAYIDDGPVTAEPPVSAAAQPATTVPSASAPAQPATTESPAPTVADTGRTVLITPAVQALADKHRITLHTLSGSGPGGRIRAQDVLVAAGAGSWQPAALRKPQHPRRDTLPGIRPVSVASQEISPARRTVHGIGSALSTLTLHQEIDVTGLVQLCEQHGNSFTAREHTDLTPLAFVLRATVEALRKNPSITGVRASAGPVHLKIDTDGNTEQPTVVENADRLNLAGLARATATGYTANPEPAETFSITAVQGAAGVLVDMPPLAERETASLGVGSVVQRPRIVAGPRGEDSISIGFVVTISLTADALRVDRRTAGSFLGAIKDRLEKAQFESDLNR